ncbi:MAG: hypothetical protein E6G35_12185 [Actinobacteria bacterium]|nr:MAG: hypothetical protein E6G35_12185 [Actinomycetota bacterium]
MDSSWSSRYSAAGLKARIWRHSSEPEELVHAYRAQVGDPQVALDGGEERGQVPDQQAGRDGPFDLLGDPPRW